MNHYEALGLNKDASSGDIKKAYRELSKKYHPDKPDGSEEMFHSINNAYEILSDPERRKQYDEFGEQTPEVILTSLFDLFDGIIAENPDSISLLIEDRIGFARNNLTERIDTVNRKVRELQAFLDRIEFAPENDYIGDRLREKIKTLENTKPGIMLQYGYIDQVEKILSQYKFKEKNSLWGIPTLKLW